MNVNDRESVVIKCGISNETTDRIRNEFQRCGVDIADAQIAIVSITKENTVILGISESANIVPLEELPPAKIRTTISASFTVVEGSTFTCINIGGKNFCIEWD